MQVEREKGKTRARERENEGDLGQVGARWSLPLFAKKRNAIPRSNLKVVFAKKKKKLQHVYLF